MSAHGSAVTMAEVAARAGVSTATVSRALGGSRPVAEKYRQRVLLAAEELGYSVNLVGRALRKQESATAGLIIPDLSNPFFSALAAHLNTAFHGTGTDLLIGSSDNDPDIEASKVESFLGRRVDAMVIIPCHESASERTVTIAARSCTTVQLDRRVNGLPVHFVGCDNYAGMRIIAEHVLLNADSPLYFLSAASTSSSGRERRDGFIAAFPASTIEGIIVGDFSFNFGQAAASELLERGVDRGTIVAAADVIALGAMARLQAEGHLVPEAFRVVGFDGIGVAPFAHPSLTTVRQPIEDMANTIVSLLKEGRDVPAQKLRLSPTFLPGGSAPCRVA